MLLPADTALSRESSRILVAVVVAKLTYAASVWWGFTSADDRPRIDAVLRRGIRAGFYQSEWPTVAQLIQNNDDTLFHRVLSWWRGSVVERRSLAGELSLSCARPAADG